ncbi:hypothetical protein QVD17_03054 [Tagetes erecta]|uniref:Uncharacterized protein n=1 Tax=Tagetes erecta TaxID=13708 RepID=A0AAD8P305_TARER|nr:hypothetical protein QVD17_03054 [Tagetes erecta]
MERTCVETTKSTSITDAEIGEHEHRFCDYSLSKGIGTGNYVASDTFMAGGYLWAIYFYPDGKYVGENCVYVSLFIVLVSEGSDVRALFELSVLDQSDKGRHIVRTHFGRRLDDGPYALKRKGSMWGYKRFYRRSLFETSDHLKDDCLHVRCRVGVIKSRTLINSVVVPPKDIGQHFGKLLECGKGSDVSFDVKGETFLAHKLVLAARSPVFKAQFFGSMRNQNSMCIKVEDIEPHVFKVLLHFIYWDSLPNLEEPTEVDTEWSSTWMFRHLLSVAERYDLFPLLVAFVLFIETNTNPKSKP